MGRDLQRSETNCLTTLGLTSCSLLNADRRGAPTTSRGSLFWCLTFQKFFLMSSLSLPWHRFEPFLCALSLDTREKRGAPPSPLPILRELQRGTRSPLSLLFSRLVNLSAHLSSQELPSSPFTGFALVWMLSRTLTSLYCIVTSLYCRAQNHMQYCR